MIIGNWRFVQNQTASQLDVRPCKLDDFYIGFKLSCTSFKSQKSTEEKNYHFDRNGVQIPLPAFVDLLRDDHIGFKNFLSEVRYEFVKDSAQNQKLLEKGAPIQEVATLEGQFDPLESADNEEELIDAYVYLAPPGLHTPPHASSSGTAHGAGGTGSGGNKKKSLPSKTPRKSTK